MYSQPLAYNSIALHGKSPEQANNDKIKSRKLMCKIVFNNNNQYVKTLNPGAKRTFRTLSNI